MALLQQETIIRYKNFFSDRFFGHFWQLLNSENMNFVWNWPIFSINYELSECLFQVKIVILSSKSEFLLGLLIEIVIFDLNSLTILGKIGQFRVKMAIFYGSPPILKPVKHICSISWFQTWCSIIMMFYFSVRISIFCDSGWILSNATRLIM